MNLRSLLVPLMALALGFATTASFAKKEVEAKTAKEHQQKIHKKAEKKQHHQPVNKHVDKKKLVTSEHGKQQHQKHKSKPDCGKNCASQARSGEHKVAKRPPPVVPVPAKVRAPTAAKASLPLPPLPDTPLEGFINETAKQAKQKAREIQSGRK